MNQKSISSTSLLDESRMNKAQQILFQQHQQYQKQKQQKQQKQQPQQQPQQQQQHHQQLQKYQQQLQQQQQQTQHHQQEIQQQQQRQQIQQQHQQQLQKPQHRPLQHQQPQHQHQQQQHQSSRSRVGVSVNQKKHIQQQQQQRSRTIHQILAEEMQSQQEISGLNIIDGSHLKKSQTRKKSTAFTQLTKPKQPIQTAVKPKRSQPKKEEPFQSIKVSAKGGVITLYAEKDEDKIEISEKMKSQITSSMYGYESNRWKNTSTHQQQQQHQHDHHEICLVQGIEESSTTHQHVVKQGVETEVVYYTVCTHFFHPEKHDWIQKIHRMGQVRVPKNRTHQETCVFMNHLYDPDKEEIIVHKLLQENEIVNKENEMMLMNENHSNTFQREKFNNDNQAIRVIASSSSSNNNHSHSNNGSNGLRSFKHLQNTSWESQAFSEAYDTMSERNDHSFDEFDTAFDARSVDSSISSKSGYHARQQQQQSKQQFNNTNDYSKYIQRRINASSDCDC